MLTKLYQNEFIMQILERSQESISKPNIQLNEETVKNK